MALNIFRDLSTSSTTGSTTWSHNINEAVNRSLTISATNASVGFKNDINITASDPLAVINITSPTTNILGNLNISGSTTTIGQETVVVDNSFFVLNTNNDTIAATENSGLVTVYNPIGPQIPGNATDYITSFISATSTINYIVSGAAPLFLIGDYILVHNSVSNDGIYEVLTIPVGGAGAGSFTIKSPATVGSEFCGSLTNELALPANNGITVTKVNVSIIRSNTSGDWQSAKGSSSAITYSGIGVFTESTTNSIYSNGSGNSGTGNTNFSAIDGSLNNVLLSGDNNVGIGLNAGSTLTTGSNNIAIGNAPVLTATLSDQIAIGRTSNVQGADGIAIGRTARTGTGISLGVGAGVSQVVTDTNNICVGNSSGSAITGGGTDNVCIGSSAGNTITTGDNNITIGNTATVTNTLSDQIAIGRTATVQGTSGVSIGNGSKAGTGVSIGLTAGADQGNFNNICIGIRAGWKISTGTENICIGLNSGGTFNLTTGQNNVCIGSNCVTNAAGTGSCVAIGVGTNAHTNSVCIGNGCSSGAFTEVIMIGTTDVGGVITGTANDQICIGINPDAATAGALFLRHRSGVAGNSAGFNTNELVDTVSSRRFKDNIENYTPDSKLFDLLRPVSFTAKEGYGAYPNDPTKYIGLIAEEINEIYPEFVVYEQDKITPKAIQYDKIVSLLIHELQEERMIRKKIEERVEKLENMY